MRIIGEGRVGGALCSRAGQRDVRLELVTRSAGWEAMSEGDDAIFVAVRTTDLPEVLERIPQRRHGDLILIQNGMLGPWLSQQGLGEVTRGVLYFAVSSRGGPITVGASSPFAGPRAAEIVEWLVGLDIAAHEVSIPAFAEIEFEKLIWNSVFGLMCGVTGKTVGTLCESDAEACRGLVEEFREIGRVSEGLELDSDQLWTSLVSYSNTIAGYTGRVTDWEWRNGWLVQRAETLSVPTPLHDAWIRRYQSL